MLRHETLPVDHLAVDLVAEFLAQHLQDGGEGLALVVRDQVLDVLQQERLRFLLGDDARHVVEQRALRGAFEAVRTAERVLLRYAGDAERLAGKAGEQHVVVGHVGDIHLRDVADQSMPGLVREIRQISFLRERVPLAGENATSALLLEAVPDAADAGEQIDEGESVVVVRRCGDQRQDALADRIHPIRRNVFLHLPAPEGGFVHLQNLGQLPLGVAVAGLTQGFERGGHGHGWLYPLGLMPRVMHDERPFCIEWEANSAGAVSQGLGRAKARCRRRTR